MSKNKRAEIDAALTLLCARYPKCFYTFQGHRRPLKIGVHKDIPTDLIDPKVLRQTLRFYVNNVGYLRNTRLGATRLDLEGNPAGIIDEKDIASAKARLAEGFGSHGKAKKKPRSEEVTPPPQKSEEAAKLSPPLPPKRAGLRELREAGRKLRRQA